MSKKMSFCEDFLDIKGPRIGGGALIGGICPWPNTPDGTPLTLILSLPADFINMQSGMDISPDLFISVFSYYSKDDYFLDYITYHGDDKELKLVRSGYTRVLLHAAGEELMGEEVVPAMSIVIRDQLEGDENLFQGSKIGEPPSFLQTETMALDGYEFVLQVRGGDFPKPYQEILFLSDAVGYLYVKNGQRSAACDEGGIFFAQVT